MPSQWLALGADADPLRRARELQRSWERLLADGALVGELPPGATAGLRSTIVESWQRSLARGLDPTDVLAPIEADESEVLGRWFEHPLGSLAHVLAEQLRRLAEESGGIVVVTDASGLILHRVGDEGLKERAAEMNLVEGARYNEAADGTNGIGTALAADRAFQVFAFEHFNQRHHEWVCSGAPLHDPVSGQTIGLIDLSSLWKVAHPRSLELVSSAARTIEQRLVELRCDQDARLRRRYGDLMTRSTDLLVSRDGRVLAGAEPEHSKAFDVPEGGGEVVLGDGSAGVAEPLGRGEAYLVRPVSARHARSAPVEVLERSEKHVRELVGEQSALRQVATLVARESTPDQLFAAVAEQVARVFAVPHVRMVRFEPEGSVVVGGFSEGDREPFPIGSRWPPDSPGVTATVRQTGRPARVEDYAELTGEIATVVRAAGVRSTVASPIVVERRLWGAMVVLSPRDEPLPEDTEARLTDFTELLATAIANAESRAAVARLADEHAALQRVATLVAQGASPRDLFAAVAKEVGRVLQVASATMGRYEPDDTVTTVASWSITEAAFPIGKRWPMVGTNVAWLVLRTGQAARIDDFSAATDPIGVLARELGATSAVASPIVVDGHVWGVITATSNEGALPPDTEARLASFTELVATAIANTEAREALARLADEQAALRRVATLVAEGVSQDTLFAAVAEEVAGLVGVDQLTIDRYDADSSTVIASLIDPGFPVGSRWPFEGSSLGRTVFETGRPARIDDYSELTSTAAEVIRSLGFGATVGAPIIVEGRVWGVICVASNRGPLPADTEERLVQFTELVATAIANAEGRSKLAESEARALELAREQAALRRVATLVARDASPGEVFDAVAMEVGTLLDTDITVVGRYDADGAATAVGSWSASPGGVPVGTRSAVGGHNVLTLVAETRRPARVDGYDDGSGEAAEIARRHGWRSSIAAPISVEGRLWGVMLVAKQQPDPFPQGAEGGLAAFTDLVATSLANAEAQDELRRHAEEQASLQRVATLVAQGMPPAAIFSAASREVEALLGADAAAVVRFEHDPPALIIVGTGDNIRSSAIGMRSEFVEGYASTGVFKTGRSARVEAGEGEVLDGAVYSHAQTAATGDSLHIKSAVASPLVVEGKLWGAITVSTSRSLAPDTEARLERFTDIVATAIANADSREALATLAAEQAALRRIATHVAQGRLPEEIFSAVAEEVAVAMGAVAAVARFDQEGRSVVITGISEETGAPIGTRLELTDGMASAEVYRTGRPARVDGYDWSARSGQVAEVARHFGIASQVATPIVVEGHLWGTITAIGRARLAEDAEQRMERFTELLATAIANAESKHELAASLRRIVSAGDEARRRIERDLHDGIQQRLIALSFRARAMTRRPPDELPGMAAELSEGLKDASDELREISRGIHPTILTEAGLGPALRALARRSDVPVDVDVRLDERLPAPVEAAAYYIASEALTNVAKHAHANVVELIAAHDDHVLTLEVRDDGIGGVDAGRGSGIIGLTDRVEALGGTISIVSPRRGGTTLSVRIPVAT